MPKKPTAPPNDPLVMLHAAPGHLIRRLQQIAVAVFLKEMKPFDLTPMQYAALAAIGARPGIDQRTLSKAVAVDRSTIGTMLRLMEKKGLITRTTPERNQRVKQVFTTKVGIRILAESQDALGRSQARILEPLDDEERRRFLTLLAKLVDFNNATSRAPLGVLGRSGRIDS
jgi:MarR family transcriptional regulator, lower aerobic nicotinate degradation pathway regulator